MSADERALDGSLCFPHDFLFGASTAAHQVEGGNTNSDWWEWEHRVGVPVHEPSGDACDSYHRYRQDIEILSDFGLTAYRFSVEWARIEPSEGAFSAAALAHYRRVLATCQEMRIIPVVTFHHFTLPRWLLEQGGFLSPRFASLFQRYCERTARALGDLIGWACTINEPEAAGDAGYMLGIHPPGIKGDQEAAARATDNVLKAHRLAVAAIRQHTDAPVGVTLALQDMQYEDGGTPGDSEWEVNARASERFIQAAEDDDFIGLQTYTRIRFGPEGQRGPGLRPEKKNDAVETSENTQVGWEFYPEALAGTIRRVALAGKGKPILLTENGIATLVDDKRIAFIDGALRAVHACLTEGIDVRGYLYWSLLDNFEWSAGFRPKFGLIEVDRETFARHPRPSGYWLGAVARRRSLPATPAPRPGLA